MRRHKLIILTGCSILAVVALTAAPRATQTGEAAAVCDPNGRTANLDFTLKDVSGHDVALSGYRGQVILLDFWATWCAPCKVEIPGFVELYDTYRDRGFVVLGVSVDDPLEKLTPFVDQFKMNYPVLLGLGRDDLKEAFGPLIGYPTQFLITRDGKICTRHTGLTPKSRIEDEIKAIL